MTNQKNQSKIVLITGCSSGFGLLISARLASLGYRVISTMRNLKKKDDLIKEVAAKGGNIDLLRLDVTDDASVKEAMETIDQKYGQIDVLINNAGYGTAGSFEDHTEEDIRRQFETNFFGLQKVTRAVIPFMRQRRKGKIINISSISGFVSYPFLGVYSSSKWAVEAFSEGLRTEMKIFGIDVLLVEPGSYRTKIFEQNGRYASNFYNEKSPYFAISLFYEKKILENISKCQKNPENIAIMVEKLIQQKNPSFRNFPDINSKILYFLKKYLPYSFFSKIVYEALLSRMKKEIN